MMVIYFFEMQAEEFSIPNIHIKPYLRSGHDMGVKSAQVVPLSAIFTNRLKPSADLRLRRFAMF